MSFGKQNQGCEQLHKEAVGGLMAPTAVTRPARKVPAPLLPKAQPAGTLPSRSKHQRSADSAPSDPMPALRPRVCSPVTSFRPLHTHVSGH